MRIWKPGCPIAHKSGMVLEHRWVAYEAGWEVPPGYLIHHKNEVRDDNRLENLEVVAIGEHGRRHAVERGFVRNQYGTFPVKVAA